MQDCLASIAALNKYAMTETMKNSTGKSEIKTMLLFLIVFVFPVMALYVPQQPARAADYYIDSVGGNDSNDGLTPSTAWKSHTKVDTVALGPGDSVRFKRGSQFSGPIEIDESGTAEDPILLTDYGQGSAPRFTNTNDLDMNGNCIRISGDYIIVENLYFHDTPATANADRLASIFQMGAIFNMPGADHNIIRNNVFKDCTKAIQSTGEYTLITNNYLDGPSHALWWDGVASGGWGPMGIQLGIGNQEVSYNTIKNYLTEQSPYGTDGGAIEFDDGRFHKENLYIHHNYSEGNAGFFESSWEADYNPEVQEVNNLRVAFNVNNDGQSYCYMFAPTHNTYFENNTIIRANNYPDPYPTFDEIVYAAFSGLTFRNNLLVGTAQTNNNPYNGASVTVENSWYWEIGTSNGDGDPLFVDFNGGDFHLLSGSPLIGQAQNLSPNYPTDFDGELLPTSGPWDIGAYMFVETACNLPGNLNDDYSVDLLDFALLGAGWQISYDMLDLKDMAADWLNYCDIGPYVVITSPSDSDSFDEGETITITAAASDPNGSIIKVEFFDGAAKLGEDLTEPYSLAWMGASVGQHSLRARATDNDDKTTTSATVNITVIVPIPPPIAGKWRSFDVVMNPSGSPQATITDGNAVTADLEFYESTNNDGVNKGSLFGTYTAGSHTDFFNHAEHLWGDTSGGPYPFAAKSTVTRGSDTGEANTPAPSGVFDLQLHPPENNHLTVAAFIMPEAGSYSVYDLAVRRVWHEGDLAGYKVFDEGKNLLTHITASTDQDWVTDPNTYNLGALTAGDRIYFAVDREDAHYYWDATEIIWTIEKN